MFARSALSSSRRLGFHSAVRLAQAPAAYRATLAARPLSTEITPFILADIGEGIAEVEVLQWFVSEGDSLSQFQPVLEVQSDKATVEITSRYDGVVHKIYHEVGDMVPVGASLLDIQTEGTSSAEAAAEPAAVEPAAVEPAAAPAAAPAAVPAASAPKGGIKTTPAVRKLAKENAVDLSLVVATGPQGRILKHDVLDYIANGGASASSTVAAPTIPAETPAAAGLAAPAAPVATFTMPASRVEKVSGITRMMVKSMEEALLVPHFGYGDEVYMDELARMRGVLNEAGLGVKFSYMPIILKATSLALAEFPILNSSLSPDKSEIVYHGHHHLGVAMDTPRGLLVPNIKHVEQKSLLEIALDLKALQELGAEGKLGEAELTGGTFSLSNIGSIGGTAMSPVIMVPQVAIGAIGKIQKLQRSHDGGASFQATSVMNVAWSGDHRLIDGATMARFSNVWKGYLEEPVKMMVHLK
mmetsp:Transcript_33305/g.88114  ORF Transcript_33305/g.88114 Transcript_33305/m.88114 type:complete len:470 (+) Transcript_33305:120-1529(+)